MEQLSIFDLDDEQFEHEKATPKEETTINLKQAAKKEHTMLGQTELEPTLKIGDQVKIKLIDEELDSETHHYRKYYEPHVLGKVGEITNITKKKNGTYTYEVNVYGTISYFEQLELIWIG